MTRGIVRDATSFVFCLNHFFLSLFSLTICYQLGCRKVGIVGLGRIGLEVAKRLEAFGCAISYFSRQKKSSIAYQFYADIYELATNCDALIICCPLNEQTRHLINKEVLMCLGDKGVIVNIARGSVIVEKDLIEFLKQGKIAGAGLDVFDNEPGIDQEFISLNNVVLTPHTGIFTEETFNDMFELVCKNLEDFFTGKPLSSLVSLE
ncbi:dehydrogenase [Lithospermum erythrorhizon]|uniref:Dehydrogenase n=1 Tax=Lithospermum erythrorhizon TaxID=34254 RepID=A0AAV3PFB8_LITER